MFRGSALSRFAPAIASMMIVAVADSQSLVSKVLLPDPVVKARLQPGTPMQEGSVGIGLHILVIEGEDGVNIVKKKTAVKPVVEVRDRNNLPVAGVAVTFTSPSQGAGAIFANGSRSITLTTDSAGRAAVAAMKPVGTGAFKLTVSASFHGHLASATIAQTNYATPAAAASAGASSTGGGAAGTSGAAGGSAGGAAAGGAAAGGATAGTAGGLSAGVIGAIVAGVAAVAVGAGVAVAHGGSKSSPATPPSITISGPGSVTAGPPH